MNEQMNYQQNTPPPNYLVFAILTTFFCCQILGIVSIIYAAQVNSRWNAGDVAGANDASRNAKLWAWIAFGSGLLIGVVTLILVVGFGMFAGLMSGFDF
jgi:ABC-type Fe3+ transport system permease subunit